MSSMLMSLVALAVHGFYPTPLLGRRALERLEKGVSFLHPLRFYRESLLKAVIFRGGHPETLNLGFEVSFWT